MTIARRGRGGGALGQEAQVAVVARTRPEVVVVVPRDETERRGDGRVRHPRPQRGDELGEGGGGVLWRGQRQFEEIAQHDQLRRLLVSLAQGPHAGTERLQHRGGPGAVDALAVLGHVGQQAVEGSEVQVGDAHPAN